LEEERLPAFAIVPVETIGDAPHRHGDPDATLDPVDPADAVATLERAPVSISRARKIVRKRAAPSADGTEEIEPQQILLETWVEPDASRLPAPPPLPERASRPSFPIGVQPILPPPPPAPGPPIGELLRATVRPTHAAPHVPLAVPGLATPLAFRPTEQDMPSVAPVALPLASLPSQGLSQALEIDLEPPPRRTSGRAVFVAFLVLGLGIGFGGAVTLALPSGTLARAKEAALSLAGRAPSRGAPAVQAAAPPSPPPSAAPAPRPPPSPVVQAAPPPPPAAPAPSAPASISVDALPKPHVPPKMTLVTLPVRAKGHRVFVDGGAFPGSVSPTKMACGRHVVKVGTRGKPQKLDFPCGGEITVP
jgi:hypothetical protein